MGFMLESNLHAGNQSVRGDREGLAYGVSITDGCIDWPTTERSLLEAAAALAYRAAG
jgi:3-deoxy-7-phosphoheptulonate synthase